MVRQNDDARSKRPCIRQFEKLPGRTVLKETFSAPQDNWMNHEPVLIDKVMLHQRMHQLSAARDLFLALFNMLLSPLSHSLVNSSSGAS